MQAVRQARAIAAVVVAGAALGLVAIAAQSGRTPVLTPITRPSSGSVPVTVSAIPPTTASPTPSPTPQTVSPGWLLGLTLLVALLVLAAAYLLGFVAWILRPSRRGRRWWWIPARLRRQPAPRPEPAAATTAALVTAVDTGLRRIEEGEPRDAVIACWVLLERAAASAGTARWPTETPAELTARVLAEQWVTADVLRRLADLYREARYSGHRQEEPVREEARAALLRLQQELTGPPAARSGGPA